MTILGMTLSGFLFFAGTVALFGWGIVLGLKGAFTEAPAFRDGGHTPGGAGSYDSRYRPEQGGQAAA